MHKTIRKGAIVKYIGDNPLMIGQTFTVHKRTGNLILISSPVRYLSGEIHLERANHNIKDFEIIG